MQDLLLNSFHRLRELAADIIQDQALLWHVAAQIAVVLLTLLALTAFGPPLRRVLDEKTHRLPRGPAHQVASVLVRITPWVLVLLALWFGAIAFGEVRLPTNLLRLAESLALAWVVIRLTSSLVRSPRLGSAIAVAAWLFAALNIVGLLDPTIQLLDSMGITIGRFRITMLLVLKGIFFLVVLIWLANLVSRLLEQRLLGSETIAPSMQVLASKLAKATLLTLAVVIALDSVGIDLTAFAVFSGAIGVGIGFGLQKVVSNLISGVILLLDRSIKPGDVIEVDGTYGWITRLNARFVSVSTRDGIEHLIPNEALITQRVTNWSYTNDLVRLHVRVGIGYGCDVREGILLCVEAAKRVPRALETPAPICLLKEFGDSSINLELRFWIRDPQNGTANVRSEVMLGIWERFRERGIDMPFPQRDLHIRDIDALIEKLAQATPLRPGVRRSMDR